MKTVTPSIPAASVMICVIRTNKTVPIFQIKHIMEQQLSSPISGIEKRTNQPQMKTTTMDGYLTNSTSKKSRKSNATRAQLSSLQERLVRSAKQRLAYTTARSVSSTTTIRAKINFTVTSAVSAKWAEGVTFFTVRLARHVSQSRPWTSISTRKSSSARIATSPWIVTSLALRCECAVVTRSTDTAFRF